MNGHWLSQTRKLNKHYQSGNMVTPVPLWGDFRIINCGGCVSQVGYDYGVILDKDGIWLHVNSSQNKGELDLGRTSIINLQGGILPLFYIMYENIFIDGQPFPDLHNVPFSDSSGKLHFKYDNVDLRYDDGVHVYSENANVILVYINVSDLSMYSQYVTNYMTFYNVKWDYSWRKPKTSRTSLQIVRNGCGVYDEYNSYLGNASYNYTKTFGYDSNLDFESDPPSIGSGVVFGSSYVDPYETFEPFFGSYGLILLCGDPQQQTSYQYTCGITMRYGVSYSGTALQATYDNFDVGNSVNYSLGYHFVEISDSNGLYFDFMSVTEQRIFCGVPHYHYGTFNGSHVTGWN